MTGFHKAEPRFRCASARGAHTHALLGGRSTGTLGGAMQGRAAGVAFIVCVMGCASQPSADLASQPTGTLGHTDVASHSI